MMADGNRNEQNVQTSRGHQMLNDDENNCREVRTTFCLSLDNSNHHHRNRVGCKRMTPLKSTRQIHPSRRKLVQATSVHYTITLLFLELFFMAPIISSFTLPPSQLPPIYKKTASTNSKSIIHSYFRQHDEYIDNDDVPNDNSPNPQLYRQNYNQLGVASAAPNDRQRMIMMNQNSGDDDEWESYLDLNIDGEGEVMMDNGVDGGKSDLPTRRKEEDLIDAPSLEHSNGDGGERRKASSSVDRRNIIDVNPNPRNEMGDKSPRRSDINTAQLRNDGNAIKGESLSVDNRKKVSHKTEVNGAVVANEIERQEDPPSNNAIPMSATKSSPDANDFRQQFMSRTNTIAKGADNDDSSEQTATTSPPSTSSTTKRKRVTTEEIEFIKSTIPLTDVIETYNLDGFTRTNTHSAKACCPFHDDNNPSMSIDDNRGLYKCFACGAGGDVFNFI
eukprot:scaffold35673_cov183-Skeletonema_dohrnii-CCMP3373.AAC.1